MNPVIAISKSEFKKHLTSEAKMGEFSIKVKETNQFNVYISPTNVQLMEFICYLRDTNINFQFYASEEELAEVFNKSPKNKAS